LDGPVSIEAAVREDDAQSAQSAATPRGAIEMPYSSTPAFFAADEHADRVEDGD